MPSSGLKSNQIKKKCIQKKKKKNSRDLGLLGLGSFCCAYLATLHVAKQLSDEGVCEGIYAHTHSSVSVSVTVRNAQTHYVKRP